ncbi:MAG TPA: WS/DGAT domain-containing protein, partial [Myxococcota bacterium]|nr:WS/DGAT domain-containing protein [Myxococcota bacterium]
KVHHCMVDGVAGAGLLEVLLDEKPRARRDAPAAPFCAQEATTPSLRAARALGVSLATPLRGVAATLGALLHPGRCAAVLSGAGEWAARAIRGEAHPLPWNAPLGPRRSIAFTRLPLDDARRVRTAHGGTVNDVVLTALAGGLRRYLQARGLRDRPDSVTAFVPVSLRAPGEATLPGNRFSALRVPLALGPAGELDRLAAISATTERLKARRSFEGLWALLSAVEVLPAPLVAHAARRAPLPTIAHLLATNVPGPRGPRWLAGKKVAALHPIAPIADGMGLSVAVFSYASWLHVGLHADAGRVDDLEKLRTGIEEAFAALRAHC